MNIKHTKSVFSIKVEETVRSCQNVEWDLTFICNISIQLVSLKTKPGPVCNFQSMKSHVELTAFYWNFFVMSTSFMGGNTGGLANEAYFSKSYSFFKTIA